jgi:threonine synthase
MVVSVSEEELANAAHRGDRIGLYCCPHTCVALGALEKLVAAGKIAKDENVVVISTAHGLKFTEFKVGYHEQKLENIASKYANPVFKAPAEIGAVMDILTKEMAARRR